MDLILIVGELAFLILCKLIIGGPCLLIVVVKLVNTEKKKCDGSNAMTATPLQKPPLVLNKNRNTKSPYKDPDIAIN